MPNSKAHSYSFKCLSVTIKIVATITLLVLTSCSGTYDWRLIQADEGAYEVMFPSKPTNAERTLQVGDSKYVMTMTAARAGDALFAVGVIDLGNDVQKVPSILDWLKENTSKSLKSVASIKEESNLSVVVAGHTKQQLSATGLKMTGSGPDDAPRLFWVRWVPRVDESGHVRIYQINILQSFKDKKDALNIQPLQEQYETFYESFHPY